MIRYYVSLKYREKILRQRSFNVLFFALKYLEELQQEMYENETVSLSYRVE